MATPDQLRASVQADRLAVGDGFASQLGALATQAEAALAADDFAQAAEGYRYLAVAYELLHGLRHPSTLFATSRLAWALLRLNRLGEAHELLLPLVQRSKRNLGARHPLTLAATAVWCETLLKAGYADEAEPALRQVLTGLAQSDAADPLPFTSLHNQGGLVAVWTDDVELAGLCFLVAFRGRQSLFGVDHPIALESEEALADLMHRADCDDWGMEHYQHLLEAYERSCGDDHPATMCSVCRLIAAECSRQNWAKAAPLLRRLMDHHQRERGSDDPVTMATAESLARVLMRSGDAAGAEPTWRDLVAQAERLRGPGHDETIAARLGHAEALLAVGQVDAGWRLLDDTLARCPPERRASHLSNSTSLVGLLYGGGRDEQALALHLQVFVACQVTRGTRDPAVLNCARDLMARLEYAGDLPAASRVCGGVLVGLDRFRREVGWEHRDHESFAAKQREYEQRLKQS